jgi:hypothetical protein
MDRHARLNGGKLLDNADKANFGTVGLKPVSPSYGTPTLLTNGSVGHSDIGSKDVLYECTHGIADSTNQFSNDQSQPSDVDRRRITGLVSR